MKKNHNQYGNTEITTEETIQELQQKTKTIRKMLLELFLEIQSGHPGGSLSALKLLVGLYFQCLRYDINNLQWAERDRFILSKGHAAPALYAVLAEAGFFPVQELKTLRQVGSRLQGHPDCQKTPGIEISTGSLGQGLSAGVGMALGAKIDQRDYHVYVMVGDGELQEGQIWEAAQAAAHFQLENLTVIIDRNGLQLDGPTENIISIEPLRDKWNSFNWSVVEIDGTRFSQIVPALTKCRHNNKPTAIIAHTIKGSGIAWMEWVPKYHGTIPNEAKLRQEIKALEDELNDI